MNIGPRRTRGALLACVSLTAFAAASSAAFAQDATAANPLDDADAPANQLDEIVVTGTLIRGAGPVGSPLLALSAEKIAETPANTTADLLRGMPQIPAIGPSDTGTGVGSQGAQLNFSFGTSVNIRGIGPSATLMLVNGRRVTLSGLSGYFYDPTVIAPEAISRIEVVPDGSSAIYGSDAIAGVVNIITHRHFDGVRANVRYGGGDGFDQVKAGIVAGHSWDGGDAVVAYNYNRRDMLRGVDRDYFRQDLRPFGGSDWRGVQASPGTLTVGGRSYIIPNQSGVGLQASDLTAGTSRLDTAPLGFIFPQQEYNSVTASVRQTLNDRIEVFADGFYSKREFMFRTAAGGGVFTVPNTNPFFVSPDPNATSVTVAYNFTNDLGEAEASGFDKNAAINIGADIKLFGDWKASVSLTHAFDDQASNLGGITQQGLRGIMVNRALADTNPATALNLFGNGTANNPETLASLYGIQGASIKSHLTNGSIKVDGSLFELPGGTVRLAVGGEIRHESVHNITEGNPSTLVLTRTADNKLDRDISALFAEVLVPIVGADNAVPGIERLDLSMAVRREDYSDFGSTTNPKIGLNWTPVHGTTIRTSYGTAYRAPTLVLMNPLQTTTQANPLLVDPTSPTGSTYAIRLTGGNPDLKPEEGETWTLGGEWRAPINDDLRFSATYFSLNYQNIVGQAPATALAQESLYASLITRNPTLAQAQAIIASSPGISTFNPTLVRAIVDGRSNNLGVTRVRGVDYTATYARETEIGDFTAGLTGTYYTKFENQITTTAPWLDMRNKINWPTRYRLQGQGSWRLGGWRVVGYANYVPSYTNNVVTPVQTVDSWLTFDGQVSYGFGDRSGMLNNVEITLDAQNIFDRDPPFVNNPAGFGYDPQQANASGRVLALQVAKRW